VKRASSIVIGASWLAVVMLAAGCNGSGETHGSGGKGGGTARGGNGRVEAFDAAKSAGRGTGDAAAALGMLSPGVGDEPHAGFETLLVLDDFEGAGVAPAGLPLLVERLGMVVGHRSIALGIRKF